MYVFVCAFLFRPIKRHPYVVKGRDLYACDRVPFFHTFYVCSDFNSTLLGVRVPRMVRFFFCFAFLRKRVCFLKQLRILFHSTVRAIDGSRFEGLNFPVHPSDSCFEGANALQFSLCHSFYLKHRPKRMPLERMKVIMKAQGGRVFASGTRQNAAHRR